MDIALSLQSEEEALVQACARQEAWAQRELYETHYSQMMNVCLRYAHKSGEAVDLLHDGFIKVFQNIGKYQPGTSLPAWIRRIMVNNCIDHYRKEVRRRTDELDQAAHISSEDVDAVSRCSEKEILEAVQSLTPTYRLVFNMYAIEGYSHKEIADCLGISESTSRSNLVKARSKLKEMLLRKER